MRSTNNNTNIQYDAYNSTKEVVKDFRSGHEDKLQNKLSCQGSFFSSVLKFSLSRLNKVWSNAQCLPTRKNLNNWEVSTNSECSFCLNPEFLLHVVTGCQSYLEHFTLKRFRFPWILKPFHHTGETCRPDLLVECSNDLILHVIEFTVGYESSLQIKYKT